MTGRSLLLLQLSVLATTATVLVTSNLQGVGAEQPEFPDLQDAPTESQCRPYIEKALKQLGTGESVPGAEDEESPDKPIAAQTDEQFPTDELDHEGSEAEHGEESQEIARGEETHSAEATSAELTGGEVSSIEDETAAQDIVTSSDSQETLEFAKSVDSQETPEVVSTESAETQEDVDSRDKREVGPESPEETIQTDETETGPEEIISPIDATSTEDETANADEGTVSTEEVETHTETSPTDGSEEEASATEQEETGAEEEVSTEEAETIVTEDGTAASVEEEAITISAEEEAASAEQSPSSGEEETAKEEINAEETAVSDEEEDEEDEGEGEEEEEKDGSVEESPTSAEEERETSDEVPASVEEDTASTEKVSSAEENIADAEIEGSDVEDESTSKQEVPQSEETTAASGEEEAGSVEDTIEDEKVSSAEATAASEEGEEPTTEEDTPSAEEGASPAEAITESEETPPIEDETANVDASQSAEEDVESAEAPPNIEEDVASVEEPTSAEEGIEEPTSAEEGIEEPASAEEGIEEATSAEEGIEEPTSAEEGTESAETPTSAEEGTESAEKTVSTEESTATSTEEDASSAEETTAASAEEGIEESLATSKETATGEEEAAAASAEQDKEPTSAEESTASQDDATSSAEEVAPEESTEGEAETAPEVPEEELTLGLVIPDNLRPRDHIAHILKLDSESAERELLLAKTVESTLKELKKIYDNAIKPLEVLYKYRDLSNRHFGDPEIFSKPLILFMGPWSGGKSSIINYLLDNEYKETALRTGAEPSPAYFNILMWGDREEVIDGTQLAADWTFSGLQKFGQGLLDRLRGLRLPNKLLEKVNIVEIPGILEIRKQVERLFPFNDACQWFIDRADIIFLVYDPAKLDVGPETEAILDQLKGREYQTRIILNKADQVRPEELMRVQGTLIWNISPLMSSSEPPVMYSTSLWSLPFETGAPIRLLQAQEKAFLQDMRTAVDKRVENKIASARRFAVRVRNHAKMVDCYLTTYYNHKGFFGNRKKVSDDIIERPQDYHIYEGLSTLTNISRYDLPDPDVYRDFFRLNPLYDFQQLSATCTYFRGCPINRLDVAIAYDLPELVGKYKKTADEVLASQQPSKS